MDMLNRCRLVFFFFCLLFPQLTWAQLSNADFVFSINTNANGVSSDSSFNLYCRAGYNYNFDLDVDNDGTFDSLSVNRNISLKFSRPGRHTIRIRGQFPAPYFGGTFSNPKDKSKLIGIEQWGDQLWLAMDSAFYACDSLTRLPNDTPNFSQLIDLSHLFENCYLLNDTLDHWDVSIIRNMKQLFYNAEHFNSPLNSWNVSQLTNMNGIFRGAISFNQSLSNWDVSGVRNMAFAFASTASFNSPLNNWDVSEVRNMNSMFLNSIFNQSLSAWNVSKVRNMNGMFKNNQQFNQALDNWDVSKVRSFIGMFSYAFQFDQDLNSWQVDSAENMQEMFFYATQFNGDISSWDVSGVLYMGQMFNNAIAFNQDITNWDVSNARFMSGMFNNAMVFNQDISNWDISSVRDLRGMFNLARSFDQNLANWDIDSVQSMISLFDSSGMSKSNYDSILIAWQAKPHLPNVIIGARNLRFCNGLAARSLLMNDGWIFQGDFLDCSTTALEEVDDPSKPFRIFPNPSQGKIRIELLDNNSSGELKLYSVQGRFILNLNLVQGVNQVDLSELESGVYFLRDEKTSEKLVISP